MFKRDGQIYIDIRKMYDDIFTEKGISLPFDYFEKLVDIFPQIIKTKNGLEGRKIENKDEEAESE